MKQPFVVARRSGRESFRSRRPWASRVTAAAAATAVVSLVAGAGGMTRASAQDNGGELARFVRQPVAWHTCHHGSDDDLGATLDEIGAQCAEVTVPLDYARPTGGTLKVAISRRKATDTAHRIGTLVVNPGGPGEGLGSGLTWVVQGMPPYVASGAPAVAARYDLVGIDPRFQNRSSPLECGWPNNQVEQAGYVGPDRRSFERSVALNAELANRCVPYAHLLPYASTRNAARDLDIVRAVLGEKKISFLGWSYGSYLGAAYAQLFPGRLARTVLDSALDPTVWGADDGRDNSPAQVAEQRNWAVWAARHDSTYHLGATPAAVMASLDVLREAADHGRQLTIGRHLVDANSIRTFGVGTDLEELYAQWAHLVSLYHDAARGRAVTLTPDDDAFFAGLSSTEVSAGASAVSATQCADRAASSRNPETYFRDIQAHLGSEPFFGPANRDVTPCTFWPARPAEPPLTITSNVPALMVGATGDPTTPYPGQLVMHRALPGSRMITLAGAFRHGVYLFDADPCVDSRVNRYLLGGTLPKTDITCTRPSPRPTAPQPTGAGTG